MSAMIVKLTRFGAVLALALLVAGCPGKNKGGDDSTADANASGMGEDGTTTATGSSDGSLTAEEMAARDGLQHVFYFGYDQSALDEETRAALDAQANAQRSGSGTIRLEGHCDERGSREYNLALGERRAKSIADYLALQGIDRSRIEVVSYGEERPAALGQDEDSMAKNRRVELR